MNQDINIALMLMGVGMITVFVVLSLVVIVGKGLVSFVNRFVPEIIVQDEPKRVAGGVQPTKIAAITAAVEIFTEGKGHITRIEKID